MPPTQTLLGPVGAMLALFFALGRFLAAFCILAALSLFLVGFLASWSAPGSILEGSGRVRRGFWRSQGLIVQCFFVHACLQCDKAADVQKPQFS